MHFKPVLFLALTSTAASWTTCPLLETRCACPVSEQELLVHYPFRSQFCSALHCSSDDGGRDEVPSWTQSSSAIEFITEKLREKSAPVEDMAGLAYSLDSAGIRTVEDIANEGSIVVPALVRALMGKPAEAVVTSITEEARAIVAPSTDIIEWSKAQPQDVERMTFEKAGDDIRRLCVNEDGKTLTKDITGKWLRDIDLDEFASSLADFHKAALIMADKLESGQDVRVDATEKVGNSVVKYLGQGVIALDIKENIVEDDANPRRGGPVVLLRRDIRSIVNKTMSHLKSANSVLVIGQPGTGKTRSGLTGLLAHLLADRAAVMRIDYKEETAQLFVPKKGGSNGYMVWSTKAEIAFASDLVD